MTILIVRREQYSFRLGLILVVPVHDIPPESSSSPAPIPSSSRSDPGDYVWDVFYHRPATLSEWNEAANVAKLYAIAIYFACALSPY